MMKSLFSLTEQLLKAISEPTSDLQSILDIGYEHLENPLLVSGKSWKVLAITNEVIEDDEEWMSFINDGVLHSDSVYLNVRNRLTEKIELSAAPFRWQNQVMRYPRMFCRIPVGGKTAATLSVVEYNRSFKNDDYEAVKYIALAIAAQLQKSSDFQYSRGLFQEEFIIELLNGENKNSALLREREKLLNLGFHKYMVVATLDISDFDSGVASVSYIRENVERILNCTAVILDERICGILSCQYPDDSIMEYAEKLQKFCRPFHIKCGFSRSFTRLEDAHIHYKNALFATSCGKLFHPDKVVFHYPDYAVYRSAALSYSKQETGKNPFVRDLEEYDKATGSSLSHTLKLYLYNGYSAPLAADALSVHRNTVLYHLRRIEDILNVDLSDARLRFELTEAYALQDYVKAKIESGG